ncbi:aspartate/glutamate racemase family protein [Pseudarthrobacter sulfonivorans]|uniref:aspartate/glutamate racemase family protein n=1 Tax=Pseudarthrobacter sulfonivorans TaxID=121292 RepID=UPI002855D9F4|nr:aspartate/glutamate racemase family protein [Pseudarthrobacter sulfonivorans]MDR6417732.1 Asp/Glu/hydantoin racemase [Pseudarthrobacter sulfonivorans]
MTETHANPLISLISATPLAIPPAAGAFREIFPEARLWNLLDDRLLDDATEQGGVTDGLAERMTRLIRHAVTEGADGILLTCSMYGPIAERLSAELTIPIYAPDASAFQAALDGRYQRILLLASAKGPLEDALERFTRTAAATGRALAVTGTVAEGAAAAAAAGDAERLGRTLEAACAGQVADFDAVLLAQYSLSPAADALSRALGKPVLAGPKLAAATLRAQLLGDRASADTNMKENA